MDLQLYSAFLIVLSGRFGLNYTNLLLPKLEVLFVFLTENTPGFDNSCLPETLTL